MQNAQKIEQKFLATVVRSFRRDYSLKLNFTIFLAYRSAKILTYSDSSRQMASREKKDHQKIRFLLGVLLFQSFDPIKVSHLFLNFARFGKTFGGMFHILR